MRLLKLDGRGGLSLTPDLIDTIPPYAILSHTWGADEDEITFEELRSEPDKNKVGYRKIQFCGEQARKDKLEYFWVDTCCINKANHTELSEAIISMFSWYCNAEKCYVYLSDVEFDDDRKSPARATWEVAFRKSRWFKRGWTLQELLAPRTVEFFSREEKLLGSKTTLEGLVHEITQIPIPALRMTSLSTFPVDERLRWVAGRDTKRTEDEAYCLLGIFDVFIPPMYGEKENAWRRLKEEIAKRAGSSLSTVHTHWIVTRSVNPLFTGREDILNDLDVVIRDAVYSYTHQTPCRIVITGIGGQGKSEICLQLAHQLRQTFWAVIWIDVSTTLGAERSFLDLAHKLALPARTWEEACLVIANLKYPWLLVLDNADDPAVDYQQYIPSGPLGVVMLTSRNEECQQYASTKAISLEGLTDESAQDLLLKAARMPSDRYRTPDQQHQLEEDARRVAHLLQSHPLALIQAGAYVWRGHCTLAQYPEVYERQRQRLLAFRPAQAQSATAMFCGSSRLPLPLFEAGRQRAQSVPVETVDDAEDANVELLTPWHVARLPPLVHVDSDSWDSFRLLEAANVLKAFALVTLDTSDGHVSVSMHPLLHAWARDRQSKNEQHENWLQMGCLVAFARKEEELWRLHERQLQPHLEVLTGWEMDQMFGGDPVMLVGRVVVNCGWLLNRMRSDVKLFMLMQKTMRRLKLEWTKVDDEWMGLYGLAARNLIYCGKGKEAVEMLEEVVDIQEKTLVETHPDRLASQQVLAAAYQANGQVKEAIRLLEEVVKIQEKTLVETHPSRLVSQYELARAYQANGQVEKAIQLLEEVVKIREKTLVETHPDRLASLHELAGAYEANGQVKEAIRLLEEVVKIREKTLVETHPDRLASLHELARVYQANGQVEKAIRLLEEVVKIREKTLVETHPSRLASLHELARVYEVNGQVKEALQLIEEVVKIREKTLVETHPDRLASLHVLAGAYQANGQVKEAIRLLEEVVKIEEKTLVETHPDRLVSQLNLAAYYWRLNLCQKAYDLMKYVVEVYKRAFDEHYPNRQIAEKWLERFDEEILADSS